jgi:EAL domain-containing protein (putative c-di-GMP-specific phosphodiesterase class I)/GGDEF domain-containing protein
LNKLTNVSAILSKHVNEQLHYTPPVEPDNEQDRLAELHELAILDTPTDEILDQLTRLMSRHFSVPMALVSLVDENRQWFKSSYGLAVKETPRDVSFCGHAVAQNDTLVVEDTLLDDRFRYNPLVLDEPNIRFYAGAIVRSANGLALGTCCIIDTKARQFSVEDAEQLKLFTKLVQDQLLHEQHVKKLENHATAIAYYNELTGLPNQKLFQDRLDQMIITGMHSKGIKVCVIRLVDFIELREVKGKEWLDQLTYYMAIRLRANLDVAINISYLDEGVFAVFYYEKSTVQLLGKSTELLLESLIEECLSEVVPLDDEQYYLNIKIGVSSFPNDSLMAEVLLNNAKSASFGESVINYFEKSNSDDLSRHHDIKQMIQHGLDHDCFYVEYQPIVNSNTGEIISFEALVRLKDKHDNVISPVDFIGVAEESETIIRIGDIVLEKVCETLRDWQNKYPNQVKPIAVNLSHRQLVLTDLPIYIEEQLNRHSISPELLQLEVTESGLLANIERAIENISAIASMGVTFSLDDFGTGYSSLSYLQRLKVVKLKLDKSFIDNICSNRSDYVLVRAIISLSHELEKLVVAEGVENAQQLALLNKHKCDFIQGFYFSRPLSHSKIDALFEQGISIISPR